MEERSATVRTNLRNYVANRRGMNSGTDVYGFMTPSAATASQVTAPNVTDEWNQPTSQGTMDTQSTGVTPYQNIYGSAKSWKEALLRKQASIQ